MLQQSRRECCFTFFGDALLCLSIGWGRWAASVPSYILLHFAHNTLNMSYPARYVIFITLHSARYLLRKSTMLVVLHDLELLLRHNDSTHVSEEIMAHMIEEQPHQYGVKTSFFFDSFALCVSWKTL